MKKITKIICTLSAAMCITLPLASCQSATNTLESPTGFSLDENYNLTWTPVENARSYLLDIKNVETGVSEEATARRENIALSYLATGDYDIQVRSVGDGSHFYDSDWSAVVSVNRAYESGCQYRLINNGSEYEIASVSASATELVLEDTYRGKPVTSVGSSAFRRAISLKTLVLGKHVTNIGENAFYNCVSLKNITIPDTVTSIGSGAFQSCKEIESFTVPSGITKLQDNTFAYCRGLKEIDLNNVTVIGNSVFNSCSSLKEFSIPDKIVSIGERAFADSVGLKEVTIGSGLVEIGNEAFLNCTALETVNFSDQGNLKAIGDSAFRSCTFSEIDLPDGLESIGYYAFYQTANLEEVSIPESVTEVGYKAFFAAKFYLDAYNAGDMLIYAEDWLVGYHKQKDKPIVNLYAENPNNLENTYCIAENTVGIASGIFLGNEDLAEVILSKNVKYVGEYAFSECPMLSRFLAVGSDLTSLGLGTFAFDESLRQVAFVNITNNTSSLTEIGDYAFYECANLNYGQGGSRFIPLSVERIGTYAFKGTGLYGNADEYGVIYADDWVVGCTGQYRVTNGGLVISPSVKIANIVLREDVRGIADYAFYNCQDLISVGNSANVARIGKGAFYDCIKLSTFVMNPNLRRIEDYAFYGCRELIIDDLPANLRSIGRSAFYCCLQMRRVNMPNRLESVGDFAYYNCKNLVSVNIGSGLTEIGDYTFYLCSQLTSVTIPGNIKKIGNSAFSRCSSLENLTIEEGVEEIGDFAFRSDEALAAISLPDSVKKVGNSAFLQCVSVKTIDLGSVEYIGDFAFAENFGVSSLSIPESVKTIGKGAFYYLGANAVDESGNELGSVSSVFISGSVDKIEANAFYGCNFATFYLEDENRNTEWGRGWNSSHRPTVWGVTLSLDKSYVLSFTVGENTFDYFDELNALGAPYREGYTFAGWSLTENGTDIAYTAQNVMTAPVGTTLYAVYIHR